jgi:hypothetical protein
MSLEKNRATPQLTSAITTPKPASPAAIRRVSMGFGMKRARRPPK